MSDNYWTENKLHISREMAPDIAAFQRPETPRARIIL